MAKLRIFRETAKYFRYYFNYGDIFSNYFVSSINSKLYTLTVWNFLFPFDGFLFSPKDIFYPRALNICFRALDSSFRPLDRCFRALNINSLEGKNIFLCGAN
jgi:hypothetical protein